MTPRFLILTSPIFFALLFLVYIYTASQSHSGPSTPIITSAPAISLSEGHATLTWQVDAPSDLIGTKPTVYFGAESTPSALTVTDSPQAVCYAHQVTEYLQDFFTLPNTFSATVNLPSERPLYARSYIHIRGNHHWSDEIMLISN
jgi:hypothetical protein